MTVYVSRRPEQTHIRLTAGPVFQSVLTPSLAHDCIPALPGTCPAYSNVCPADVSHFLLQNIYGPTVPWVVFFFWSNATTCPCALRGPPSWAWQQYNRLLRLGRQQGTFTLSRWCEWWYRRMELKMLQCFFFVTCGASSGNILRNWD